PVTLAPRYRTYVEISAPKSRQSEARNSHIASFVLGSPVLVACSSTTSGRASACPIALASPSLRRRLEDPAVEAGQRHDEADAHEPPSEDEPVADDGQAEGGDQRLVRRPREGDGGRA